MVFTKNISIMVGLFCLLLLQAGPSFASSPMSLSRARAILQVTAESSPQEIDMAHRRLRMKYHPDRVHTNASASAEAFKMIDEAYRVIKSNTKKEPSKQVDKYDRLRNEIILHPQAVDKMIENSILKASPEDRSFSETLINKIFLQIENSTKLLPRSAKAFLEKDFPSAQKEKLVLRIIREKSFLLTCSQLFQ